MSNAKSRPTAKVQTSVRRGEVPETEEIALPPEEMMAELDNSGSGNVVSEAKQEPTLQPEADVAVLEFDDEVIGTIPLKHTFNLDGQRVTEITMRRLTVHQVGLLIDKLPVPRPDNFDIYAEMCGLPAPVLRGLKDDDGVEVARQGLDFLPQIFK